MTEESKITATKIRNIWHGYHAHYPQVDERGLTEEIAKRKVEELVESGVLSRDGRTNCRDTHVAK